MDRGAAVQLAAAVQGITCTRSLLLLLLLVLLLLLLSAIRLVLAASPSSSGGEASRRRRSSASNGNGNLPPSPPGKLPIIGHFHLVGSLPHVSLRDLATKHGHDGLLSLRLGAVPTVVVSSPRAAEAVLRTHDHVLASRARSAVADIVLYGSSDVAFAPYGEYWRQARKLVTAHMLSARKVHSFSHGRHQEVRIAVSRIHEAAAAPAPRTAVDMSDLLSAYTNDVVCRAVLGESHRDQDRNRLLRELVAINVSLLGVFNLEDYFPRLAMAAVLTRVLCAKAKRVSKRWDHLFDKLVDERTRWSNKPACRHKEENHTSDFICVLLSLQEEYGLTRDNVKAIVLDMFQGGIETSYLVLEYAMAELMNNRHVMAKLRKEVRRSCTPVGKKLDMVREEDLSSMTYLKATVKETLRLHPPAPFLLPHLSMADCKIGGYSIPSGTRVIVNAWALGRDPTSWERPDEFMPERFLQGGSAVDVDMIKGKYLQFVPFGSGRRICPGINFGIATVEIMLANLMYHFDWELQNETKAGTTGGGVDMKELLGLSLRRKEKLFLVPKIP